MKISINQFVLTVLVELWIGVRVGGVREPYEPGPENGDISAPCQGNDPVGAECGGGYKISGGGEGGGSSLVFSSEGGFIVCDGSWGCMQPQAVAYCENLTQEGKSNWRLPTIDELQIINDNLATDKKTTEEYSLLYKRDANGWLWSSTPGYSSGESMMFNFAQSDLPPVSYRETFTNARALCVSD